MMRELASVEAIRIPKGGVPLEELRRRSREMLAYIGGQKGRLKNDIASAGGSPSPEAVRGFLERGNALMLEEQNLSLAGAMKIGEKEFQYYVQPSRQKGKVTVLFEDEHTLDGDPIPVDARTVHEAFEKHAKSLSARQGSASSSMEFIGAKVYEPPVSSKEFADQFDKAMRMYKTVRRTMASLQEEPLFVKEAEELQLLGDLLARATADGASARDKKAYVRAVEQFGESNLKAIFDTHNSQLQDIETRAQEGEAAARALERQQARLEANTEAVYANNILKPMSVKKRIVLGGLALAALPAAFFIPGVGGYLACIAVPKAIFGTVIGGAMTGGAASAGFVRVRHALAKRELRKYNAAREWWMPEKRLERAPREYAVPVAIGAGAGAFFALAVPLAFEAVGGPAAVRKVVQWFGYTCGSPEFPSSRRESPPAVPADVHERVHKRQMGMWPPEGVVGKVGVDVAEAPVYEPPPATVEQPPLAAAPPAQPPAGEVPPPVVLEPPPQPRRGLQFRVDPDAIGVSGYPRSSPNADGAVNLTDAINKSLGDLLSEDTEFGFRRAFFGWLDGALSTHPNPSAPQFRARNVAELLTSMGAPDVRGVISKDMWRDGGIINLQPLYGNRQFMQDAVAWIQARGTFGVHAGSAQETLARLFLRANTEGIQTLEAARLALGIGVSR